MKKLLFVFWCVTVFFAMPMIAGASVLTFDDLHTDEYGPGYGNVPANYGGLTWYWWGYLDKWTDIKNSLGVVSPTQVAYNGSGMDTWIAGASPFTFNGAYFTAWYLDPLDIEIKGYFDGSLLYQTTVLAYTTGPVYASLNWTGIDRLTFAAGGQWIHHFSMDNFTYNQSVPEPATMVLLGFGLIGLLRYRRKFKE